MPGADTVAGAEAGVGAGALALLWGHMPIPTMGMLTTGIMGILTALIIGPTIIPIILTVIDGG